MFVTALCALVLFVAQALAGNVTYYCLCNGKLVPAQSSHCHGPHGENCHEKDSTADGKHSEEGAGERKDHVAISQDQQLRPTDTIQKVAVPPVLLAVLPLVETFFARQEVKVPVSYPVEWKESPPFGVTVARTVVLLI